MSTEWYEPFLVVGTGRCGSSTTARVLHEHFGVHMGASFNEPDETNPQGFYEDRLFKSNNIRLLNRDIGAREWRSRFEELLIERRALGRPWGLKDPRICEVWPLMARYCKFTRLIRCRREQEQVIASLVRCYGHSEKDATNGWLHRELQLDEMAHGKVHAVIDFSERRTDEWVQQWLRSGPLGEHLVGVAGAVA